MYYRTHERARKNLQTAHTKPSKTNTGSRLAWAREKPDPGEPGKTQTSPSERNLNGMQIWTNKLSRIMEQSLAEQGKWVCSSL